MQVYDNDSGEWIDDGGVWETDDPRWRRMVDSEGRTVIFAGKKINGRYTHRPPGPEYAPGAANGLEDDA